MLTEKSKKMKSNNYYLKEYAARNFGGLVFLLIVHRGRGSKITGHYNTPYSQLMSCWNENFVLVCDWLIS